MSGGAKGRLFLLGAGGHGRVVADIAEALGWRDIAFLDDRWPELAGNLAWPVVGTCRDLASRLESGDAVLVAIGDNRRRLEVHRALARQGIAVPALVHPSAVVSRHSSIGIGTVIMPGAVVNAGAAIGEASIVNTGASVDHDCRLGDGVHVSPGARLAGGVSVGEGSWIGIGAVVRERLRIGRDATIGAGAAAVTDIGDREVATGVPATTRMRKTVAQH
jgi:sugar O-acyltransferase (sialic acid O-acetyltransferase NeuD family)